MGGLLCEPEGGGEPVVRPPLQEARLQAGPGVVVVGVGGVEAVDPGRWNSTTFRPVTLCAGRTSRPSALPNQAAPWS